MDTRLDLGKSRQRKVDCLLLSSSLSKRPRQRPLPRLSSQEGGWSRAKWRDFHRTHRILLEPSVCFHQQQTGLGSVGVGGISELTSLGL